MRRVADIAYAARNVIGAAEPLDDTPALLRLERLVRQDAVAAVALRIAAARSIDLERGADLVTEGEPVTRQLLLLEGWAGRTRLFADGRLQILSFVLPGDLIGNCGHDKAVFVSTVTAFTNLRYCEAPAADVAPTLCEVYAVSRAFDEAYLLAQIARLGQLSAQDRSVDLLLELNERLELCGLARGGGFDFPLTQTALADATGLTVVHINRTLQHLRLEGKLSWIGRALQLTDAVALSATLGRQVTRVNAPD